MGVSVAKAQLISMWAETMLYGAYSVLVVVTMAILVRQSGRSLLRRPIFYVTILMYTLSSCDIVLVLIQNLRAFIDENAGSGSPSAAFNDESNSIIVTEVFLVTINCILADSIFIWRVWIVWSKNIWVTAIPASVLIATTVTGLLWAHSFLTTPDGQSIFSGNIGKFSYPAAACILITNLLCTSLIAGRIWYMKRKIWEGIGTKSVIKSSDSTYRLIALTIIESGLLYSAVWLAIILSVVFGTNGTYIVFDMASQLTGIVPTTIVLLSRLQLSIGTDIEHEYLTTMKFNSNPTDVCHKSKLTQSARLEEVPTTRSSLFIVTLNSSDSEAALGSNGVSPTRFEPLRDTEGNLRVSVKGGAERCQRHDHKTGKEAIEDIQSM